MLSKTLLMYVALTTAALQGQSLPSLVNGSGSPLKLVSITGTLDDFADQVVLTNAGSKTIRAFQLGLLLAAPAGCAAQEVIGSQELLREEQWTVPAGASVTAHQYGLSPDKWLQFQSRFGAKVVLSQIAVVSVTFADGSTWSMPPHGGMYDNGMYGQDASSKCRMTAATRAQQAAYRRACALAGGMPGISSHYSCGDGQQQSCAVGGGGTSCTSTFCTNQATCPNQSCAATIVPVSPAP